MLSIADERAFGFYGVIRYFGWKKITLLVQDENLFTIVSGIMSFLYEGNLLHTKKVSTVVDTFETFLWSGS